MTTRDDFRAMVADLAAKAHRTLPDESAGRIDAAVALVLADDVVVSANGTATVGSATDPLRTYVVNGECTCPDATRAPQGLCKHRLSKAIQIRAERALRTLEEGDVTQASQQPENGNRNDAPAHEGSNVDIETPDVPDATLTVIGALKSIPAFLRDHAVIIRGKPFIQYAGLLALAHERGIVSLKAKFISVTSELALAEAEVVFADGRTFTEAADATPANVGATVRHAFARMALTRAKARCLRDGLSIGICALEELGEGDHG
jgi:hypothetical protein